MQQLRENVELAKLDSGGHCDVLFGKSGREYKRKINNFLKKHKLS